MFFTVAHAAFSATLKAYATEPSLVLQREQGDLEKLGRFLLSVLNDQRRALGALCLGAHCIASNP
jgi:hypothetical protein